MQATKSKPSRPINPATCYVLGRRNTFYTDLDWTGPSPVCRGNGKELSSGTRVCLAQRGTNGNTDLVTAPVNGVPMYAWIDRHDILTPSEALAEGVISRI